MLWVIALVLSCRIRLSWPSRTANAAETWTSPLTTATRNPPDRGAEPEFQQRGALRVARGMLPRVPEIVAETRLPEQRPRVGLQEC